MVRWLFVLSMYIALLYPVKAGDSIFLVPHRAVYDLQLHDADPVAGISRISGKMVREFANSACQDYTTYVHLEGKIYFGDEFALPMEWKSVDYETRDSRKFHFETNRRIGQGPHESSEGVVERTQDKVVIKMKKPDERSYEVSLANFPVMQLKTIIQHAKSGRHFYQGNLVEDGKIVKVSVIIGEKVASSSSGVEKLANKSYWPLTISYFDDTGNGDGLPTYSVKSLLSEDGVMGDHVIAYEDFSISAKLVHFEHIDYKKDSDKCEH
ncbi:EipB family protein [Bartonella ancashensis]|nr:DUF1849 family protein [Bartonella ancashensis]